MNKINPNSILVLGLGNPLLSDDTIGLFIVDELDKLIGLFPSASFKVNYSGGFDILYDLIGFKTVIIIDSIQSDQAEPGFCQIFSLAEIESITQNRLFSSHALNLSSIIRLGLKCGYEMPQEVIIYGIQGSVFHEFSEEPSDQVKSKIDHIVGLIGQRIKQLHND